MTDLAQKPGVTGTAVQLTFAKLRARLVARYQMVNLPGRPEELRKGDHIISLGYGCGSIRVRKHGGERNRDWIDHIEVQAGSFEFGPVYEFLDAWMGYIDRTTQKGTE